MFLSTKEDYYQWDTGQRVELYPDGGAEITELHMYNDRIGGPALVLPIKNDANGTRYADIPDLLFQRAGRIIFWGAVSDTHGSVTVEEHDGINVLPRAKPTDYVYTAPDVLNYKDLLQLYKTLSEQYNDLLEKLDAGAFAAGGYYTPEITQLDDSTMQVAFVPSQENMAQVLAQRVSLPPGPAGPQGEMGSPGVYVQDDEPTDPNWTLWIKRTGGYNLRIPDATAEMTQPVGRNADGQLVTAPGGGAGNFEWIDTIDIATDIPEQGAGKTYTLDAVTEILLIWTNMENGTNTNSQLNVTFNGGNVFSAVTPRTGKTGEPLNGYTLYRLLPGVGLLPLSSRGALLSSNYAIDVNGGYPYNVFPVVSDYIDELSIGQPITQYYATSGRIAVYVR